MIWKNLNEITQSEPCVATIGFFDGVHKGHQYLIRQVIDRAREAGLAAVIITFDKHPREVVDGQYRPALLSTAEEKRILLSKTGIDACVVLPFDKAMAATDARTFMTSILKERLNVRQLVIGYDHRFGHDRTEGFEDYVRYGRELDMDVVQGTPLSLQGRSVSSSLIRKYIEAGEMELAEACLGYPYTLAGMVAGGYQEGRRLGFPTANMEVKDKRKLIPEAGVYAVKARVEKTMEMKRAMMNIGSRPTFGGDALSLETHILHFTDDIYGQRLRVFFVHRIREERKFDTAEALAEQLKEDKEIVEKQFEKEIEE